MMNKRILALSLPNIVSNITVPLLGIVDLSLMGHLGTDDYIGAIALGTMIFNFIYWGFGFLRMGTTGFTAQEYGRRDLREAAAVFSRAILLSVLSGVFLILLQPFIAWMGFALVKGEPAVEMLAREYFYIRIWAAPATLSLYVFSGWFIGMQNARFPMFIAIMVNVLNIAFNLLFVKVFDMKVSGVALGTVLAQYAGLILSVFLLFKYYKKLFRHLKWKVVMQLHAFKKFMLVNKDIFIRTLCLIFVFSFFTAKSAQADTLLQEDKTILAVNTLLMQFFMFFSYLIDGFAYAAEALTGKYVGSKNKGSLLKAVKILFIWGSGIALFFTLVYGVFGKNLLYLLTDNQEVIENSKPYIFWIVLVPVISFAAFLWDGIFVGATASVAMRNSMLMATVIFFFPVFYLLQNDMGNHSIWLAFLFFMAARGISLSLMAKKSIFGRISVRSES